MYIPCGAFTKWTCPFGKCPKWNIHMQSNYDGFIWFIRSLTGIFKDFEEFVRNLESLQNPRKSLGIHGPSKHAVQRRSSEPLEKHRECDRPSKILKTSWAFWPPPLETKPCDFTGVLGGGGYKDCAAQRRGLAMFRFAVRSCVRLFFVCFSAPHLDGP